jgi:hypothetical protein
MMERLRLATTAATSAGVYDVLPRRSTVDFLVTTPGFMSTGILNSTQTHLGEPPTWPQDARLEEVVPSLRNLNATRRSCAVRTGVAQAAAQCRRRSLAKACAAGAEQSAAAQSRCRCSLAEVSLMRGVRSKRCDSARVCARKSLLSKILCTGLDTRHSEYKLQLKFAIRDVCTA